MRGLSIPLPLVAFVLAVCFGGMGADVAHAKPQDAKQTAKKVQNFSSYKPKAKRLARRKIQNFSARKWELNPRYLPKIVRYVTDEKPGTIIINTRRRYLYYVLGNDKAKRYGIGVGRQGFQWSGVARVGRKAEWPDWIPPKEMIEREKKQYGRTLPERMPGGPNNPLGARALYLYKDGRDTLYRIHGTNQPWTIGRAVSSGCIRMRNEDVIDLYNKVRVGTKVIVK
ncbi:L,D-transpeptidase [Thermopetrobacter sp. TC1]|uniref:L,D-transpeptidase n=1 Tax=Thermopetrobacter sp. TC1 TaxID=1495045 RepID=UPI0009DD1CC1